MPKLTWRKLLIHSARILRIRTKATPLSLGKPREKEVKDQTRRKEEIDQTKRKENRER